MSRDCVSVDANTSIQSFVDTQLLRSPAACYAVTEGAQFVGLLGARDTRRVARDRWAQTPVRAAMHPLERLRTLSPDSKATEALELMGREDLAQVPVLSQGFLEGIVLRSQITQVLQTRAQLKAA
jgi:CBS domain-containing protein